MNLHRSDIKRSRVTAPDYCELRKTFDYLDGELYWKPNSKLNQTKLAGCSPRGSGRYKVVRWNNILYPTHRLIFMYHNGYWPENEVDHIDRDRSNNRIENLREVSAQCNARNSSRGKNNRSGISGVCWNRLTGKWQAAISVMRKSMYLGNYTELVDAVRARHAAEVAMGWPGCNETTCAYRYLKDRELL